jgi:cell division protein ZapA
VNDVRTVSVSILDKEYQVACPADQEAELIVSASYLDKQMRSIRQSGKVIGLERIAVMAALNISHELLRASEEDEVPQEPQVSDDAVTNLTRKIEKAIFSLRQMEIG